MSVKGKNKILKWGLKGHGMKRHARSGVAPHNKKNAIERSREVNLELQKQIELKKKHRGQMFSSVKEVFIN